MRFLFVMDPIAGIQIHLDSTFAIMLEAERRGHELLYCLMHELYLESGEPGAKVQRCRTQAVQGEHAVLSDAGTVNLKALDAVFMRKDPPFNMEYIFATYILEAAEPHTLVVNRACNLRNHNEKLYALEFPEYCPESLVSADPDHILAFQKELKAPLIVKPLDGNGGRGIFLVDPSDPNTSVILEVSTIHGTRPVIAQRFLPEAKYGDKRILLVDGEFQGAVMRIPGESDPRGNIHVGATCHKTVLTEREEAMVVALGPRMRADGHVFVGIDVIGDCLTEINVTSPTCIHEINALDGRCVEGAILDAVERQVQRDCS